MCSNVDKSQKYVQKKPNPKEHILLWFLRSPTVPTPFIEKIITSLPNCLCTFIQNQVTIFRWSFSGLLTLFNCSTCVCLCYHHNVLVTKDLQQLLKLHLYFKIVFGYSRFMAYPCKYPSQLVSTRISCQNVRWNCTLHQ